ncbi:MAG: hypothetical protein AM326_12205 [Candidatus Thorarchaeota archaeon SMTZ-45]|nr:MAG: hypothetical protein AM326_12205 [Candidatus Thorarchaeota archaeon SMTZ-45]
MKTLGRTVRTYRDAVRIEEARWKDFRRTLRPSQRNRFDRIFDCARGFADAGTMMVTPRIIEVILLSAVLEILGELDEIQRRVQVLEEKIDNK